MKRNKPTDRMIAQDEAEHTLQRGLIEDIGSDSIIEGMEPVQFDHTVRRGGCRRRPPAVMQVIARPVEDLTLTKGWMVEVGN